MEEFLKTYLKNKCSYAHKRGYLGENTNHKQEEASDDEQKQEQKQEIYKDHTWGRVNGLGKASGEDDGDIYASDVGSKINFWPYFSNINKFFWYGFKQI